MLLYVYVKIFFNLKYMTNIDNTQQEIDDKEINTSNIFDDFSVDDAQHTNITWEKKTKELVYYIYIVGSIFKWINFLLFFIIFIWFFYITIQKSESDFFHNKDYLNPICSFLSWNDDIFSSSVLNIQNCSWIKKLNMVLDKRIENSKKEQFKEITKILSKSYIVKNIFSSPKSLFVLKKSTDKFDPLKIFNEFDLLKNQFTWEEVGKIKCDNSTIKDNVISLKCHAYTIWWTKIPWLNWERTLSNLEGTSVSLAASFLNYLQNSENFELLNKQKTFEAKNYFGDWAYSDVTDFKVEAEYHKQKKTNLKY